MASVTALEETQPLKSKAPIRRNSASFSAFSGLESYQTDRNLPTYEENWRQKVGESVRFFCHSKYGYGLQITLNLSMLLLNLYLIVYEFLYLRPFSYQPIPSPEWFIVCDILIVVVLFLEIAVRYAEYEFDWRGYFREFGNLGDVLVLLVSIAVLIIYFYEDDITARAQDNLSLLFVRIFRDIVRLFRCVWFMFTLYESFLHTFENMDDQDEFSKRILTVGDGDFSFSLSLSNMGYTNLVATSFDDLPTLLSKYEQVAQNITRLESKHTVLHEIDASALQTHFQNEKFDRVIFNNPRTYPTKEDISLMKENGIKLRIATFFVNERLIDDFLREASGLLSENGEIHITRKIYMYFGKKRRDFKIENRGRDFVRLIKEEEFYPSDFPGYNHVKTMKDQNIANKSEIRKAPDGYLKYVFKKVNHPHDGSLHEE